MGKCLDSGSDLGRQHVRVLCYANADIYVVPDFHIDLSPPSDHQTNDCAQVILINFLISESSLLFPGLWRPQVHLDEFSGANVGSGIHRTEVLRIK